MNGQREPALSRVGGGVAPAGSWLMVLSVPRGANLPSQDPAASEFKPPSHGTHLPVSAARVRSAQARPAQELCRRGQACPVKRAN